MKRATPGKVVVPSIAANTPAMAVKQRVPFVEIERNPFDDDAWDRDEASAT